MEAAGPSIFTVVTWMVGAVISIGMPLLVFFLNRLFTGIKESRDAAEKAQSETKENRGEIHRLEVKMSSDFAPKSELAELRSEMRAGFQKTQELIMELVRNGK